MLDTIKNHYRNILAARKRAADAAKALETEVADAERHITALATGLFDEEKAKLEAWLADNKIEAVGEKTSE